MSIYYNIAEDIWDCYYWGNVDGGLVIPDSNVGASYIFENFDI